ncbi:MAG TPA: hypothetical protein VJA40_05290 [archaeon]|nr:hypothetical protein [archaeon]
MAKTYAELSAGALGMAGAITGIAWWVVGIVWHGLFRQPSITGMMYNAPYMQPALQAGLLVALAVIGYVTGWVMARAYNWALKK